MINLIRIIIKSYYFTFIVGFIFGYSLACLMMVAKGNTRADIDYDCHSFQGEENDRPK